MMNNVFLLQITECNPCFDEPYNRIEAVYSSYPTKKQLLDVARKLDVKSPYQMVYSGWGDLTYDEYTSVRYEIIEMPLL